jgi:hypothetical protein
VSKYGRLIKSGDGKKEPNVEGQIEFQKKVEDYVLMLQEKVSEGRIKPTTCVSMLPPVKLFCEMNDILLNWKIISRILPRYDTNAIDEAYTREQIKKMLEYCDLRTRVIVLFLASGGFRLGGLITLTDGAINPIYDEQTGKLLAAHVEMYKDTDDSYDTFVSPEAYFAYSEYKNVRIKYGEKITKDSPVLFRRFNVKKSLIVDSSSEKWYVIIAVIVANQFQIQLFQWFLE